MSEAVLKDARHTIPVTRSAGRIAITLGVIVGAFVLAHLIPGGSDYPANLVIPFAEWISAFMNWVKSTFTWLTRGVGHTISVFSWDHILVRGLAPPEGFVPPVGYAPPVA